MHIEADDPECAVLLADTAQTIREHDGFVSEDLIVREQDGEFSCAVLGDQDTPGRILLDYPAALRPPVHLVTWDPHPDQMIPVSGLQTFTPAQRALLDSWLQLVGRSHKLARIRESVPRFSVADWPLRHQLADAGYPSLREESTTDAVRDTLLGWHGMGEGRDAAGRVNWHLIPLKNLVNHHPAGADQSPLPGRVAVVTSSISSTAGTYENYGDLDAMQLLMHFGYVDRAAPLVHSIPVEVHDDRVGRIAVRWRGPRADRGPARLQITADDDGLRVSHLAIRPDNRGDLVDALARDLAASNWISAGEAASVAQTILDAILQANLDYYRRLDDLIVTSSGTSVGALAAIAEVSLTQQERLRRWG